MAQPTRDAQRATEFEALLEPILAGAYGLALQLTRNRADAEDLVQEAALLAFRGFEGFERGTNFRAWFFRILTNTFLSGRRKRRPEAEAVPFEDVPVAYMQRQAREIASAEQAGDLVRAVLGKLETEEVTAAIEALPEEFRLVAALYFVRDSSYQEISEILGIPVGTVRSRLHRGRRLLQKRLWQIAQDHGLVAGAAPGEGRTG
ncbi:MAG: sigma-70 family RNA polymerase sigma factor [Gemmatimonadetes bacterium]|nr:sigma-70 family RNA polymerase sigma factor [Gemmatimonadota bacterium]